MPSIIRSSVGIALFFTICSCQSEQEIPPTIEIISPESGARFSFRDSAYVLVETARDNQVDLFLSQEERVISVQQRLVGQAADQREFLLIFNDPQLASGNYEIKATAYRDGATRSDLLSIWYEELEKKLIGVASLSDGSLGFTDTLNQLKSIAVPQGDQLEVSSSLGQIAVGDSSERTRLYDFNLSLAGEGNLPQPQGFRQFNDLLAEGQFFYQFEAREAISRLNQRGEANPAFSFDSNRQPLTGAFSNDRLAVILGELGNPLKELWILNSSFNGVARQAFLGAGEFMISSFGSDRWAILRYDGLKTEFIIYDFAANNLTRRFELTGEKPRAIATQRGISKVAFSTDLGIYTFQESDGNIPKKLSQFSSPDLAFEELSGALYILGNQGVERLSSSGVRNPVFRTLSGAKEFELTYNK